MCNCILLWGFGVSYRTSLDTNLTRNTRAPYFTP